MQSLPAVPFKTLLFEVPMMTFVPAGQQAALLPRMTVTRCVAVVTFPASSVAVQVTMVVPGGKLAGLLFVTVTLVSQLSVAVAVPMLNEPQVDVVMSAGTAVNTGGVTSSTVTVALHEAVA